MDAIRIPYIGRILSMSLQTIDTFSTWSEDLEVRLNSKSTDFPIKKIEYTMKKLADYKLDTVIPRVNTLFYLLTGTILNVVGSHETLPSSSKKSFSQIIRDKVQKLTSSGSILPIPTFDEITVCQLYGDMKQLYKLTEEHQKIYRKLQKQQEVCWIAKGKVTRYEICLFTARKSRSCMSDKLPAKELDSRDEAIEQLQRILECKVQKAADASQTYKLLLDREHMTRSSMKEIESKLVDALMFGLTEKVITGLSSLQNILTSKSHQRSTMLLSHIQRLKSDSRCFAASIIGSLSTEYKCCSPQEYHEQNGFNVRLQDCSLNKSIPHQKQTAVKLNEGQQSTNNNSENPNSFDCNFISNKRLEPEQLEYNQVFHSPRLLTGSVVKQKIATESSSVVFGWCKAKPWNRKRWGFFNKVISS